jgi:RNA polymerase sigma factor (sigma-70 family)
VDELGWLDEHMARLADGDRSAVEPLFAALWAPVHGYCERALGSGADADDAAQQALEKIFAQVARYDRRRRALPWVIEVVIWECRTVRRRRQRARTVPLDRGDEMPTTAASPEEVVVTKDLVARAWATLAHLSEADREVLRATFAGDVEGPAEVSGAAMRKRRERAIGRLRAAWRKHYGH